MDFQEFPKWKYRGAKAVLVNSKQEEADIGSGWADAPSDSQQDDAPEVDPRDAEIADLREQLAKAQAQAQAKPAAQAQAQAVKKPAAAS